MDNIVKEVEIPSCEEHQGFFKTKVKIKWICPVCGNPRGIIKRVKSYDGSLYMLCDGWINTCGHVDKYYNVRKEAKENGLN